VTAAPRALIAALAAAAALAAGCGEKKDTTTGSGSASSGTSSSPQSVAVRETEFRIAPADPKISKPGRVKFVIRNAGKTKHALEVEGPGGEQKTKTIEPGKSATLDATLKAGSYEWYCPVDRHKAKGMKGEFKVGSSAGGTSTTPKKDDKGGGSRYY
jgi:uncharacterized cupredoxin-like copper-binding protein